MNSISKYTTIFLLLLLSTLGTWAQENTSKDGVALQGYDPVSYFTLKKPVVGIKSNAVKYNGAVYYFANTSTKELFKKDPAKYAPAYGGWCAYAMGKMGEKVEIDPLTYKIKNGKLLLFYNKYFNNTLEDWNEDEVGLYPKAEANWSRIKN